MDVLIRHVCPVHGAVQRLEAETQGRRPPLRGGHRMKREGNTLRFLSASRAKDLESSNRSGHEMLGAALCFMQAHVKSRVLAD